MHKEDPSLVKDDIKEIVSRLGSFAFDLSGKRVMITGGGGFIGRYLMAVIQYMNETCLERPCSVVSIDNFVSSPSSWNAVSGSKHFRLWERDIIQPLPFDEPLDYVVHAAGIASPAHYRARPLETLQVAIWGTKNMLELAAANQAKFVYFSSSEIYGDPDPANIPTREDYRGNVSSQGPRACYDESKRVGETLCYLFHETQGVATTIIRPFNVYGPGMQQNDYRVLPSFADKIVRNIPIEVYGSGNQTRTFCYVTDAITGFILTMLRGRPGETYNIGNPEPEISMLGLVQAIERVLDKPLEYLLRTYPDTYPGDEPNRRCPDISKARAHLGYAPAVSLDEGLRRFFDWVRPVYKNAMADVAL